MENLKRNYFVVVSREEAELIRKEYSEGASINALHKKFGRNRATIDRIITGRHHSLR
jgi:plasmid maintenance system antidote protein VapI